MTHLHLKTGTVHLPILEQVQTALLNPGRTTEPFLLLLLYSTGQVELIPLRIHKPLNPFPR